MRFVPFSRWLKRGDNEVLSDSRTIIEKNWIKEKESWLNRKPLTFTELSQVLEEVASNAWRRSEAPVMVGDTTVMIDNTLWIVELMTI